MDRKERGQSCQRLKTVARRVAHHYAPENDQAPATRTEEAMNNIEEAENVERVMIKEEEKYLIVDTKGKI